MAEQPVDRDKPPYQFDYSGYNIGGPVVLPNFNGGRNKLFLFWNQEFLPRTNPGTLTRRIMPTEAERRGDFSQSIQHERTADCRARPVDR